MAASWSLGCSGDIVPLKSTVPVRPPDSFPGSSSLGWLWEESFLEAQPRVCPPPGLAMVLYALNSLSFLKKTREVSRHFTWTLIKSTDPFLASSILSSFTHLDNTTVCGHDLDIQQQSPRNDIYRNGTTLHMRSISISWATIISPKHTDNCRPAKVYFESNYR